MKTFWLPALGIALGAAFLAARGLAQAPGPALTTLHAFAGGKDGCHPAGPVIAKSGILYGATTFGGISTECNVGTDSNGCGTVFELAAPASPGGVRTESVLYSFDSQKGDGIFPYGGLVAGAHGEIYGTTTSGGSYGYGNVFELAPPASPGGAWTEKVLYEFCAQPNCADGGDPQTGLTMGTDGVLYGTAGGGTYAGCVGGPPGGGCGTVFALTPPASQGGFWSESVLYSFQGGSDGAGPSAPVIIGPDGTLYGATEFGGGPSQWGTIFELMPPVSPGGAWTERVVHAFLGGSDGSYPSGVAVSGNGALFGATVGGGITSSCGGGCGTMFELTPSASPSEAWTKTTLYDFADGSDGSTPRGGVTMGKDGTLYGTTYGHEGGPASLGTVFELAPGNPWAETTLHTFGYGDGRQPASSLIFNRGTGELFGTTYLGGGAVNIPSGCGTVFEWRP